MTRAGSTGPDPAWPEALLTSVRHLPAHSNLLVALSGGLDSVLLLQCAARLFPDRLTAIHINHQLQPNSAVTEGFCRDLCQMLGIPSRIMSVEVKTSSTGAGGLEEAARKARYTAFESCLGEGDLLLMAHHADDQAETVLFRLVRGSGVRGLAGMPVARGVGKGTLFRPFLDFTRAELESWAQQLGLDWVEDPSNQDQRFDRNFLRRSIVPLLRQRWPNLHRRLAASARACRENDQLADSLARLHFERCRMTDGGLSLEALAEMSVVEQKNLIRWWVGRQGFSPPDPADWSGLMSDFLQTEADRQPEYRGEGYSLRRHHDALYVVPGKVAMAEEGFRLEPGRDSLWQGWHISLERVAEPSGPAPVLWVHSRRGGERIRVRPGGHSKPLKKWLQEQGVPAWERERLPLIAETDADEPRLVAVGNLWVCERYRGDAPASGWRLILERDSD